MADAYTRAERCFALARSTTFPAERDTAIALGTTIANAAGLELDWFDIPGRQRYASVDAPRMAFRSQPAPDDYSAAEVGRLMREHLQRMRDAIIAAEETAGAKDGETAYDARRRNFAAACEAAKRRDAEAVARR